MLLLLKNTKDNQRDPTQMDGVLRALLLANHNREPVRFLYGLHEGRVGMFIICPDHLGRLLQNQIPTHYPTVDVIVLPEDTLAPSQGQTVWSVDLSLRPDLYPIQRFSQYQETDSRQVADPVAAILAAVSTDQETNLRPCIEIVTVPISRYRQWRARRAVHRLACPDMRHALERSGWYAQGITDHRWYVRLAFWLYGLKRHTIQQGVSAQEITGASSQQHNHESAIAAAHQKVGAFAFESYFRVIVSAPQAAQEQALAKLIELKAAIGKTADPTMARFTASTLRQTADWPPVPKHRGSLLSTEELATLFHPETQHVSTSGVIHNECRKPEPPHELPKNNEQSRSDIVRLGRVQYRQRRDVFGIRSIDRRRHIYIPGKTGMGKTTLLKNMIIDDIHLGRGVAVIDPHGDLASDIAHSIPRKRWNDVVLFDPADTEYPIDFQPLASSDGVRPEMTAQAMLSTFAHLYRSVWGPRMESVFRNALLAAVEMPDATLLSAFQMLTDAAYREKNAGRITNPMVRTFWMDKFPNWNARLRQEAIEPVLNKLESYLTDPTLRRILGQPTGRLNLRRVMDEGKILIVNLSKGNIGEDNSRLLGSILMTKFQQDAMSRSNVPEEERPDFYLYVDEFQNFATPSFETILSEARKYRLNLTLAHQYLGQLDGESTKIRKAIFGNVGTIISFGLGHEDAQFVSGEFREKVSASDLVQLPKYHAYAALMIDGQTSDPFLMQTLKPSESFQSDDNFKALRNASRSRYATPAEQIDRQIQQQLAFV